MLFRTIAKLYNEHKPVLFLLLVSLLIYSFLVIHKYIHFAYNDWDMAFYNQSLWNLIHGRLFSELYALKPWGAHAEFLIDFSAPLLWISPHPLTFTFVQIAFFVLSAWLFYLMAVKEIDKFPALLITAAYLFCPPNLLALCHDHNAESLSPFFIMLAVYLFRKNKAAPYFVSLFFLLLVKENMAFVVAMLGIWGLLAKDRNRLVWGVLPLAIACIYFIFVYACIIPFFRGAPYTVWSRYAYLGATKKEIFQSLLKFTTWKKILTNPLNQNFVLSLFSVFLLPALLSPFILMLMLPILGYHILSDFVPEKSLYNVYALSMTPMIFLATVHTLKKFELKGIVLVLVCLFLLGGSFVQMHKYRVPLAIKTGFSHDSNDADKWRMVNHIPKDASVIATFEFLPALSLRKGLYSFHKVYSREYQDEASMRESMFYVGQPPFRVPDDVSYALINFNDDWLSNAMRNDGEYAGKKIEEFMKDWEKIDSSGAVKLFKRRSSG